MAQEIVINTYYRSLLLLLIIILPLSAETLPITKDGFTTSGQNIKVLEAVPSIYPDVAILGGVSGNVIIEAQIDSYGHVFRTKVITGHPFLRRSAEASCRKWLFGASRKNKIRTVKISFIYILMPSDTPDEDLQPVYLYPYSFRIKSRVSDLINTEDVDPA